MKKDDAPDEMVEKILAIDNSVIMVGISNTQGKIISHGFSKYAPEETKQFMTKVMRDKGFVPALATSIFDEDARYLGKVEYVVASFKKIKALFISLQTRGLIIAIALPPNTNSTSVAAQVRNLFSD